MLCLFAGNAWTSYTVNRSHNIEKIDAISPCKSAHGQEIPSVFFQVFLSLGILNEIPGSLML